MDVKLIDHMGTDLTVVNAARVSFDKESEWDIRVDSEVNDYGYFEARVKVLSDKDKKLINYLANHGHWTPFSHPQITMREKVPIFVARQRFKHMIGFAYNEVSRRYVDSPPSFHYPDSWRLRAENKKQGSSDEVLTGLDYDSLDRAYHRLIDECEAWYTYALELGVAPEQARMILPQSMYTEYYVTGSLAAWARAYKLRIDDHAQKEIQDLAKQWNIILEPLYPVSWKALTNGT